MNKYKVLITKLYISGEGTSKCFGNSMLPILSNPSICTYRVQDSYSIGDIVFCKVNGRYIDAHKITKIGSDGRYMIANNHGHENGWTSNVYARVVRSEDKYGNIKEH